MNFKVQKIKTEDFSNHLSIPLNQNEQKDIVNLQSNNVKKENTNVEQTNESEKIVQLKLGNKKEEMKKESDQDEIGFTEEELEQIIQDTKNPINSKEDKYVEKQKLNKLFGNCKQQVNNESNSMKNGKIGNLIWYGSIIGIIGKYLLL